MIDAKIHGKFIFAEIKLDQADCKNSFELQEWENLNSEKIFKEFPRRFLKKKFWILKNLDSILVSKHPDVLDPDCFARINWFKARISKIYRNSHTYGFSAKQKIDFKAKNPHQVKIFHCKSSNNEKNRACTSQAPFSSEVLF